MALSIAEIRDYCLNMKRDAVTEEFPFGEVLRLIDHSYEQVAKGLPKALRLKAARA